jgi:5-methylcytosine-specific restriction endonuclease McrA
MSHFDYATQEEIMCEACTSPAVDIHHIYGRGEGREVISNLMALCRKCHEKAHNGKITKSEFQLIHNCFMAGKRIIFLR